MTGSHGSQTEIVESEGKPEESSSKSLNSEDGRSASNVSATESDSEDEFITERFIKEHKENLQKRVEYLQGTLDSLRKQITEEKEMWKKELEEFNQMKAPSNEENTTNPVEIQEFKLSDYQKKLAEHQETLAHSQKEQKQLWRTVALTEYKRRLLEVESLCNLELLRVKQSVQTLQPLQKMICEWSSDFPRSDERLNSEDISSKSTVTLTTDNEDISENPKEKIESEDESKDEDNKGIVPPNPLTPRTRIYTDFAEVCAKMQNFMLSLPKTAALATMAKEGDATKGQSAVWCSAYSLQ